MEFENVISAVLVLLILSLITEKVSNFLKLNSTRLSIPQNSLLFETSRVRDIQKRTAIIGVIIAIFCKANLFMIFNPDSPLFWSRNELPFFINDNIEWNATFDWVSFLGIIFGSVLTGLFLSFGSKFFHDLLDLLLEAKNLKRKLAERADWDFDTIEEVDKYLLSNDSADAKAKIKELLANYAAIEYYKVDYPNRLIYVYASDTKDISSQLSVQSALGSALFKIIIASSSTKKVVALSIKPGIQIANSNPYKGTNFGSAGLIVQDINSSEKYILTCYHAVWNDALNWSGFANTPACSIKSPLNGTIIGSLYIGIKNYKLDIALIKPNSDLATDNILLNNRKPKAVRTLTENDVKTGTRLSMVSRKNPNRYSHGTCANINCHVQLEYPDSQKRWLEKLIQIEKLGVDPFSIRGDSGSLVIDEFDYAVGLLVAGDEDTTSFAIPIESILNNYNLKLII